MSTRLALAFAILLVGCAPGSYRDLGKPALVVVTVEEGSFCSSVYAVDGDNAVWASGGCGDSISALEQREMTVSASVRADLDAQMDAVLALTDDPECDLPTTTGRRFRFLRTTDDDGDPPGSRHCEPSVPAEARALASALEALAAPATADAGQDAGADAGP